MRKWIVVIHPYAQRLAILREFERRIVDGKMNGDFLSISDQIMWLERVVEGVPIRVQRQ